MFFRERLASAQVIGQFPPGPDLDAALQAIHHTAYDPNLVLAIIAIYMKCAVVAAITLLISTFASTQIFTVIVSMMFYLIGHVQPIVREYATASSASHGSPLLKVFFAFVALVFPDFQLFDLVDDVLAGTAVPMDVFGKMLVFGCGYIVIYTLVGYLLFADKEL
jgi:hypothetical protein